MLNTRRPPVSSLITARNIEPIPFRSELTFVAWTSSVSNCDGSIEVAGNARCAGCHLGRASPQPEHHPIHPRIPSEAYAPTLGEEELRKLTKDGVIPDENGLPTDLFTPT